MTSEPRRRPLLLLPSLSTYPTRHHWVIGLTDDATLDHKLNFDFDLDIWDFVCATKGGIDLPKRNSIGIGQLAREEREGETETALIVFTDI